MHIRTNRIGLLSIQASAPVVAGTWTDTHLEFTVRIDQVTTGNPLLDPELHLLIGELTGGTLAFAGRQNGTAGSGTASTGTARCELLYSGTASAGDITVALSLLATPVGDRRLDLTGKSSFSDVRTPLPGLGYVEHLEVDIDGHLDLR